MEKYDENLVAVQQARSLAAGFCSIFNIIFVILSI